MVGNPNHGKDGKFSSGKGGYGQGQTLKGKYQEPNKTFKSDAVKGPRGGPIQDPKLPSRERWGRLNNTEKARLQASAQFKTTMRSGKSAGREPSKVQSDEKIFINPTGKKGGSIPVFKYHESPAAVAIKTSQALERDFHSAREKADKSSMHAALASSKVSITKLPPGKPPKYGAKGKMK